MYDFREKNNLLSWNMDTYGTRKVTYEKVQLIATLAAATVNPARKNVMNGNL